MASRRPRRWVWFLTGGLALVVIALVAGPFIYIHFIEDDPAPRLKLSTPPSTAQAADVTAVPLAGSWKAGSGSKAQYRVNEVLFGQDNTATRATTAVTRSITNAGTPGKAARLTLDLTPRKRDESRRDKQVPGPITKNPQVP